MEIDKNGYPRGRIKYSNLVHRQIAYKEIYLKNRDKYTLPFSKYQVHHKNGNKKDFRVENLEILTESQHRDKHGLPPKNESLFAEEENKLSLKELVEKKRIKMEEDENNFSFTGKHRPNYKINQDSVDKIWNNKWVAPKKEKSRKKNWFWILIILFLIGFVAYPYIKDRVEIKNWAELPTNTSQQNSPQPVVCAQDAKQCPDGSYVSRVAPTCEFKACPALPAYTVEGSMQDIIIKNNLVEDISLNVTYKIFSNWYGANRIEHQIFEVEANETKSFLVYPNDGCVYNLGKTLDCSVSIISFNKLN